jgi:hypothetical protein
MPKRRMAASGGLHESCAFQRGYFTCFYRMSVRALWVSELYCVISKRVVRLLRCLIHEKNEPTSPEKSVKESCKLSIESSLLANKYRGSIVIDLPWYTSKPSWWLLYYETSQNKEYCWPLAKPALFSLKNNTHVAANGENYFSFICVRFSNIVNIF